MNNNKKIREGSAAGKDVSEIRKISLFFLTREGIKKILIVS